MDANGKELITGLYGEGDFIGYLDLLESDEYRESAMAMEDVEAAMIPREDFFALIYHNRDVAIRFIRMLSNNALELKERLLDLAYASVRKRVADSLLSIQKKYIETGMDSTLPISRENLASHVGITPETLSRTLHDFIEEDLIGISEEHEIVIRSRDKLSRMKN